VKSEFYVVKNGTCVGPTTNLAKRVPNSPTHHWEVQIHGATLKLWDLKVTPQYWLRYACWPATAVCSPTNNSVIVLLGRHKKKDQTALQPFNELIASKLCVSPRKLRWMDVAGSCGMAPGAVNSCKLTDIMKKTDQTHDPDQIVGKWYLQAASWPNSHFVATDIKKTGETHQFDFVTTTKLENCSNGPPVSGNISHLHGCHYILKYNISHKSPDHVHVVEVTNSTVILYNCKAAGNDGTCPAHNTDVRFSSRNVNLKPGEYEAFLAKMKEFCVDPSDIYKLNPGKCSRGPKILKPLYE
jgi:hypothetical protein